MVRAIVVFFVLCLAGCNPASREGAHDSLGADSVSGSPNVQADSSPKETLYDFRSFVPFGFVIKDSVVGDLNMDAFPDAVLVLRPIDEAWMDQRARPVLVLIGGPAGHFEMAVRNDHVTLPKEAGQMFGEPYNGVEIDSGTFIVKHYGGSRFRWTCDYVFEYDETERSWFYVANYVSIGDMLGEMNDLDSVGQCIPYDRDTLMLRKKTDIRNFDCGNAERAELKY